MSVEKLPDGRGYKVRWRDSAGKSRRKTVTLWRDAVRLDGEMKRKKAMGELIAHEKGRITLNDFWEVWCKQTTNISSRTSETYSRLWKKHIAPALGSSSLGHVSREAVTSMTSSLGATLAPASIRQCLAILQGVLERAVEWGYIPTNPAKGIRKPKLVRREGRALGHDELAALLSELPDSRSIVIAGVLAASGIRPGELRALRWGDNRGDRLVIERAVSSNQIGPTKTNSRRSVPIDGRLSDVLKRWRFEHNLDPVDGLMFPGANGRVWTDQGWRMWQRQVFRPAAQRAGLGDLRPYDLRHTYASQRIAAGDDILTLASQLGHSPTMTLTVYGHLLKGGRDGRVQDDHRSLDRTGRSALDA